MSISGLSFSNGAPLSFLNGTASKSNSNAAVYVPSVGNEGSYLQTSPDIAHPVTTDEDAINNILNYLPDTHAASNPNLLFYALNQQVASGDLSGMQSIIKSYTDSFSASNQSTNPWPTPSALFLSDLKSLGDAATSGVVTDVTSLLNKAKFDSGTNIAPPSSATDVALRNNANIKAGLEMEGYSASDATAQADAITIGGLVGKTGDVAKDKLRSEEITAISRELALEAFSSDKKTAQSSDAALSNIVNTLVGATSIDDANSSLTSLDKVYG